MLERLMTLEHNEYITVTQNNISFMIYVKGIRLCFTVIEITAFDTVYIH
jgi:hypothetical protein